MKSISRRSFINHSLGLGAAALINPHSITRVFADEPSKRLSYLSFRGVNFEGEWSVTEIEGKISKDLHGDLYRIAPGQKENHGVTYQHPFDGDAYLSRFSFDGSQTVRMKSRFVNTPERAEEIAKGAMIYNEYGTKNPNFMPLLKTPKNTPNVNVIPWEGGLLAFSEGGTPSFINKKDFSFIGHHDFHGTLSADVGFTAHPKFDPKTGEGFAYGMHHGKDLALEIFHIDPKSHKLKTLYTLPQNGLYALHDMVLTEDYLMFILPPLTYDLLGALTGYKSLFDSTQFWDKNPTRIIIARRDGQGTPITIEQPAWCVAHNGNAFQQDGKIILDTFMTPDFSSRDMIRSWPQAKLVNSTPDTMIRLTIDPIEGKILNNTSYGHSTEYPRFDERRIGTNIRTLYTMESGNPEDQLVNTAILKHDLHRGKTERAETLPHRTLGETIFVPHPGTDSEDLGWLMTMGYDSERDETFLEIRDAGSFEFEARVWTKRFIPLGFHGNFATK